MVSGSNKVVTFLQCCEDGRPASRDRDPGNTSRSMSGIIGSIIRWYCTVYVARSIIRPSHSNNSGAQAYSDPRVRPIPRCRITGRFRQGIIGGGAIARNGLHQSSARLVKLSRRASKLLPTDLPKCPLAGTVWQQATTTHT